MGYTDYRLINMRWTLLETQPEFQINMLNQSTQMGIPMAVAVRIDDWL